MDSEFELFLSNINVELKDQPLQQKNNYINEKNKKAVKNNIVFFEERKIDNFNFGVVTIKSKYPTIPFDEMILNIGKVNKPITELIYNTSLIIIFHDEQKNFNHTISDLFFSSKKTKSSAKIEYDILHNIIFSNETISDIFRELNKKIKTS